MLQEISNLMIEMARAHLGGSAVFQMEPEEGLVKCQAVVNALQMFRDLYDIHKRELPVYFNEADEAKNWDFLPQLVFKRYDKFLERMKKLLVSFVKFLSEYFKVLTGPLQLNTGIFPAIL